MTVIAQYRLKCDFCGNVSPVVKAAYGEFAERPPGWVDGPPPEFFAEPKHFCTPAHKEAWEKQQAEQTA
jgi:hypothetical protein